MGEGGGGEHGIEVGTDQAPCLQVPNALNVAPGERLGTAPPHLAEALIDGRDLFQQDLLAALDREFEEIRSQDWAVDAQETKLGISAIGSPVFDRDGKVCGAVGVVALTSRMAGAHSERVGEVLDAARQATELISS